MKIKNYEHTYVTIRK